MSKLVNRALESNDPDFLSRVTAYQQRYKDQYNMTWEEARLAASQDYLEFSKTGKWNSGEMKPERFRQLRSYVEDNGLNIERMNKRSDAGAMDKGESLSPYEITYDDKGRFGVISRRLPEDKSGPSLTQEGFKNDIEVKAYNRALNDYLNENMDLKHKIEKNMDWAQLFDKDTKEMTAQGSRMMIDYEALKSTLGYNEAQKVARGIRLRMPKYTASEEYRQMKESNERGFLESSMDMAIEGVTETLNSLPNILTKSPIQLASHDTKYTDEQLKQINAIVKGSEGDSILENQKKDFDTYEYVAAGKKYTTTKDNVTGNYQNLQTSLMYNAAKTMVNFIALGGVMKAVTKGLSMIRPVGNVLKALETNATAGEAFSIAKETGATTKEALGKALGTLGKSMTREAIVSESIFGPAGAIEWMKMTPEEREASGQAGTFGFLRASLLNPAVGMGMGGALTSAPTTGHRAGNILFDKLVTGPVSTMLGMETMNIMNDLFGGAQKKINDKGEVYNEYTSIPFKAFNSDEYYKASGKGWQDYWEPQIKLLIAGAMTGGVHAVKDLIMTGVKNHNFSAETGGFLRDYLETNYYKIRERVENSMTLTDEEKARMKTVSNNAFMLSMQLRLGQGEGMIHENGQGVRITKAERENARTEVEKLLEDEGKLEEANEFDKQILTGRTLMFDKLNVEASIRERIATELGYDKVHQMTERVMAERKKSSPELIEKLSRGIEDSPSLSRMSKARKDMALSHLVASAPFHDAFGRVGDIESSTVFNGREKSAMMDILTDAMDSMPDLTWSKGEYALKKNHLEVQDKLMQTDEAVESLESRLLNLREEASQVGRGETESVAEEVAKKGRLKSLFEESQSLESQIAELTKQKEALTKEEESIRGMREGIKAQSDLQLYSDLSRMYEIQLGPQKARPLTKDERSALSRELGVAPRNVDMLKKIAKDFENTDPAVSLRASKLLEKHYDAKIKGVYKEVSKNISEKRYRDNPTEAQGDKDALILRMMSETMPKSQLELIGYVPEEEHASLKTKVEELLQKEKAAKPAEKSRLRDEFLEEMLPNKKGNKDYMNMLVNEYERVQQAEAGAGVLRPAQQTPATPIEQKPVEVRVNASQQEVKTAQPETLHELDAPGPDGKKVTSRILKEARIALMNLYYEEDPEATYDNILGAVKNLKGNVTLGDLAGQVDASKGTVWPKEELEAIKKSLNVTDSTPIEEVLKKERARVLGEKFQEAKPVEAPKETPKVEPVKAGAPAGTPQEGKTVVTKTETPAAAKADPLDKLTEEDYINYNAGSLTQKGIETARGEGKNKAVEDIREKAQTTLDYLQDQENWDETKPSQILEKKKAYLKKMGVDLNGLNENDINKEAASKSSFFQNILGEPLSEGKRIFDNRNRVMEVSRREGRNIKPFADAVFEGVKERFNPESLEKIKEALLKSTDNLTDEDIKSLRLIMSELYRLDAPKEYATAIENMILDVTRFGEFLNVGDRVFPRPNAEGLPEGANEADYYAAVGKIERYFLTEGMDEQALREWSDRVSKGGRGYEGNKVIDETVKGILEKAGMKDYYDLMQADSKTSRDLKRVIYNYAMDFYNNFASPEKFKGGFYGDKDFYGGRIYKVLSPSEYKALKSSALQGIVTVLGLKMSPDSFTAEKLDAVMEERLKNLSRDDFAGLLKLAQKVQARDFTGFNGYKLDFEKEWFLGKVMKEAEGRFMDAFQKVMGNPLIKGLYDKANESGQLGNITLEAMAEKMGFWDPKTKDVSLSGLNPSLYGTTEINGKRYDNLELVLAHELAHPIARGLLEKDAEFRNAMQDMAREVLEAMDKYGKKGSEGDFFGETKFSKSYLEEAKNLFMRDGKIDVEEFIAYATGGQTALQPFMNEMKSKTATGEGKSFWHELIEKFISFIRKDSELKKFADLVEASFDRKAKAGELSDEIASEVETEVAKPMEVTGEYISDDEVMKIIEDANKNSNLSEGDVKFMEDTLTPSGEKVPENRIDDRVVQDIDNIFKRVGENSPYIDSVMDEIWKEAGDMRKIIPVLARIVGSEGDNIYSAVHSFDFDTFRGMFEDRQTDSDRIRRDKAMIRDIFSDTSDKKHAPNGTTKEELYEAKVRRLYLNTKSLVRVKFVDALMEGKNITLKALPENFKDSDGNRRTSYRTRVDLMNKTEDLKKIFGEDFEVVFVNSYNGTTFHDTPNRGRFTVEKMTETAYKNGYLYLNQFADKSTYPMLRLTGEGKKPEAILSKIQELYKSYRNMFLAAGEDPSLFMTDKEIEDKKNQARLTTITMRTVLEDLKLGLDAESVGKRSRLFNMAPDGTVKPENMITLMKRYQMASELQAMEFDKFTMDKVKAMTFMGRPLVGDKETDPIFVRDGKLWVNAVVMSTKDIVNMTGQSRLDGGSIYLRGQFDEVYKALQGTVNDGVLKNFILHKGMYMKHAMHAWNPEDLLGQIMTKNGLGLVIADESEKNKPHYTYELNQEGKVMPVGDVEREYEVASYGDLEKGQFKRIQIPLDSINRIKEDASYGEKAMGWSQIANASGFSKMNPMMSEVLVELMSRFAKGNALVMNELVGSDEKVMNMFRRRVLRAIDEPFTPQERTFSRMFRSLKGTDKSSEELFNAFGGFLTHSVVRDVLKDYMKMPLYEQVKQQRKGSKITLGMDGGKYSSSRLRHAETHLGRMAFMDRETLASLGVEPLLASKMEAVARVWINNDKSMREAEYYIQRGEYNTKADTFRYEREARASRKIAVEAKKALNALISQHREAIGMEPLDYNNRDYDITVKNLGDKGAGHLEKLKGEVFDEQGFLRSGYSMISEDVAHRLGLRAGDEIVTTITPSDSAMALHTSKVAVILPRQAVNDNLVVLNSEYIQGVGKDYDVDAVNIFIKDGRVMNRSEVKEGLTEDAWKTFIQEAKGLDRRYVRGVFKIMDEMGIISPEDMELHNKTLADIKASGIDQSRKSELTDYAKMKLAFSSSVQKKFMQKYLGEATDVKPRYNPLENDSLNLGNKFFKNVGEAVMLRELHDILSAMEFKSEVNIAGRKFKIDIAGSKSDWMKAHLALLILTNDQVDYPKNNNKDYYRSETLNVFAKMMGLPYPELTRDLKGVALDEAKDAQKVVEQAHKAFLSLFEELSGVPRFRQDSTEPDRMSSTIMRVVAGKSVLDAIEAKDEGLPDVIGTNAIAKGEAAEMFRRAKINKEGLLKYPLFNMVRTMDISKIEREMGRFNEFYSGGFSDFDHMQKMEFEISGRLGEKYFHNSSLLRQVFEDAMKGIGNPELNSEMHNFQEEVKRQKTKLMDEMNEYYKEGGLDRVRSRATAAVETLTKLKSRFQKSHEAPTEALRSKMRSSVARDYDRLVKKFGSGGFTGQAENMKDFSTTLGEGEVTETMLQASIDRFKRGLRDLERDSKNKNYRVPDKALEKLVRKSDIFMNAIYEWYVREMTHEKPEARRPGHLMTNRELGNLRQTIAGVIKGKTRETDRIMRFDNQSAADYFRNKKDVAGEMTLKALESQSLELGRGEVDPRTKKATGMYDIKARFKGHDFTLHMAPVREDGFTKIKTEVVMDGRSIGTVLGRPESSNSEAEEMMTKVLKDPETWKLAHNRKVLGDDFLQMHKANNFPFEDRQAMITEYIAKLVKEGKVNERDLSEIFVSYMGLRRINYAGFNLQVGSQKNNNILYSLMGTFTPKLLSEYMKAYYELSPEVKKTLKTEREEFGSVIFDIGQFIQDRTRMSGEPMENPHDKTPDSIEFAERDEEMRPMADVFTTMEPRTSHTDEEVDLPYLERWHKYASQEMPLTKASKWKAREFVKRAKEDPDKAELELRELAQDLTIYNAVRGIKPLEEVRRVIATARPREMKKYLERLDTTLERNVMTDLEDIRMKGGSVRPYSLGQLYLELVSARDAYDSQKSNWFHRMMNSATSDKWSRFWTKGHNILSFAHMNGIKAYGKNSELEAYVPDFNPVFTRNAGGVGVSASYNMQLMPWEVQQFMAHSGVNLRTQDRFFGPLEESIMQQAELDKRLNLIMHEATSRYADAEKQFSTLYREAGRTVENRLKFNETVNKYLTEFQYTPELAVIKDQYSNNLKVLMPDETGERKIYGSPEQMASRYLEDKGMNPLDPQFKHEQMALASAFQYRYVYTKVVPGMLSGTIEFIKRSMEMANDPYTKEQYRNRLMRYEALSIFINKGELKRMTTQEEMDRLEFEPNVQDGEDNFTHSFTPKLWTRESFIHNYVRYYRMDYENKTRKAISAAVAKGKSGEPLTEEESRLIGLRGTDGRDNVTDYVMDKLKRDATLKAGEGLFVNPIFQNLYDTRVPGHMTNTMTAHMHFMAALKDHIFNDVTYINSMTYEAKAFRLGESKFVRDTVKGWFSQMSTYYQLHSGKVEKSALKKGMYVSFYVNEMDHGSLMPRLRSGKIEQVTRDNITITNALDEKRTWRISDVYTPGENGAADLDRLSVFKREGIIERFEDARRGENGVELSPMGYLMGGAAELYEGLNKAYVMATLGWASGFSAMARNIVGGMQSITEERMTNLFRLPLPGLKNTTAQMRADVQKAKLDHNEYEGLQEVIKGVSSINTNMMLDVLSEGMNLETDTSTMHLFPGMLKNNAFLLKVYMSSYKYDGYIKKLRELETTLNRARFTGEGVTQAELDILKHKEDYQALLRQGLSDSEKINPDDPRMKEIESALKGRMASQFELSRPVAAKLFWKGVRQSISQGMMSMMNRPEAWMRTTSAILAYRQAEEMGFKPHEANVIAMKAVMNQHQFYGSMYRIFAQNTRLGKTMFALNHYVNGKVRSMTELLRGTKDQFLLFGVKGLDPFRKEIKVGGERFKENDTHRLANLVASSVMLDNIGQYVWGASYVVNPVMGAALGMTRLLLKTFDDDRKNPKDTEPVTSQQAFFAANALMQLKFGTGAGFVVSVPYSLSSGNLKDFLTNVNPKSGKILGTIGRDLTDYNVDALVGWNRIIKAATGFGINRTGPGHILGVSYGLGGLLLPGGNDLMNFFVDEGQERFNHRMEMKRTLPERRMEKRQKEMDMRDQNVRNSEFWRYIHGN